MKLIIRDYIKHNRGRLISGIGLAVCVPAICVLYGIQWSSTSGKLLLCAAALAEISAVLAVMRILLMTPLRLKRQLGAMPEEERSRIIGGYPDAKVADCHHYLEAHFIFYNAEKLNLLRYADVQAAEKRGAGLALTVDGYKKPLVMPFADYGANAVAAAFLRSKNPDIKITTPERTE